LQVVPSPSATQPTVAKTTRVCAYDRPYTRPDGPERSTPVPQPHTVQHDVNDLVKLVAGAKLSTPLVVAADSYGGLVADSGQHMMLYEPHAVSDAMVTIVDRVRSGVRPR
jgi:hypothetical protein